MSRKKNKRNIQVNLEIIIIPFLSIIFSCKKPSNPNDNNGIQENFVKVLWYKYLKFFSEENPLPENALQ